MRHNKGEGGTKGTGKKTNVSGKDKSIMKRFVLAWLCAAALFACTSNAQLTNYTKLAVLSEAAVVTIDQFRELSDSNLLSATWAATYDDSAFGLSIVGNFGSAPLNLNIVGNQSGSLGETLRFSYTGNGSLGAQPLGVTGASTWNWDPAINGYSTMDFDQIGESVSWWKWLRAAERLLGWLVGSKLPPPVASAPDIILEEVSDWIEKKYHKPERPSQPPPPQYPKTAMLDAPGYELISTVFAETDEGDIVITTKYHDWIMQGKVHETEATGTLLAVPEPAMFGGFAGVFLIAGVITLRRRRQDNQ